MRRRPKPADKLANIFRTIVFFVVLGETAALVYLLTRPKPEARSEFLAEAGKNHSVIIDDERFPIPARPGQKIVLTVENSRTPPPPLPEQRTRVPFTDAQAEQSVPKVSRFHFYYNTPEELRWFRLQEKLDNLRGRDDWNTVLNVTKWVREQFEPGTPREAPSQNSLKLLPQLRSGKEQGAAAQYCVIAIQAMQSLGGKARQVSLGNHDILEVFVPSHRRWIAIDPLNMVHFEDAKGRKLSALEIYRKRKEAKAVPATTVESAQPDAYRHLKYWLRNDLFTTPVNTYDLNRWQVTAIFDPSDLNDLYSGDLYTFFPDELYAPAPTKEEE